MVEICSIEHPDHLSDDTSSEKRSCKFTTHASTCITKAHVNLSSLVTNLKKLQQEIAVNDAKTREKLTRDIKIKTPKLEPIKSGTAVSAFNPGTVKKQFVASIEHNEIIDSKFDGSVKSQLLVIRNAELLLDRLESNRKHMAELLEKEKLRTKSLRSKIDGHAYKRIHDLPKAVQEEHERRAYDVQELKWHCDYRGRVESRLCEKVRVTEISNLKILQEIDFVKENSPLIKEKLKLESDDMAVIQEKQCESDKQLKIALQNLRAIETRFEKVKQKADMEHKALRNQILALSNELKNNLELFLNLQEEYESLSNIINSRLKEIEMETKEMTQLDKKFVKLQELESYFEGKVEIMTEEIFAQTSECKALTEKNGRFEEKLSLQATEMKNMCKSFEQSIRSKTDEFQKLLRDNKAISKEIKFLNKRISRSTKQKSADAKSVKRAVTEQEKIAADLESIKEETNRIRLKHDKLLLKLDQIRANSLEEEENLNFQSEVLKKQCKEESHATMILQARINADSADFMKKKEECELKREKLLKLKKDIDGVLGNINQQIDKLDRKFKEKAKAIEEVNENLAKETLRTKDEDKRLTIELNVFRNDEKELQSKHTKLVEKQTEMRETTTALTKKMKDMSSSSIVMNKAVITNENAIEELNDEVEELNIRIESGIALEGKLKESLKEVQDRCQKHHTQREQQMENRTADKVKLQEVFTQAMDENKELALQYVIFQNKHIIQKHQFINAYEKAAIACDTLDDKRNLCDLHSRLHDALKCYYQLRGIQTKTNLARFEAMVKNSNEKLEIIQKELETTTKNISKFLNTSFQSYQKIALLT